MNFTSDFPTFTAKMLEMGTKVGRVIDEFEIKIYFDELGEFPLELVCNAIDKALRDRDLDDQYQLTMPVNVPEIRRAIRELQTSGKEAVKIGCEQCNGTGWVTKQDSDGHLVARRCKCLEEAINKGREKKTNDLQSHREAGCMPSLRDKYRPEDS